MEDLVVARRRRNEGIWAALYLWGAVHCFACDLTPGLDVWLRMAFFPLSILLTMGFIFSLIVAIRLDQTLHFHTTIMETTDGDDDEQQSGEA